MLKLWLLSAKDTVPEVFSKIAVESEFQLMVVPAVKFVELLCIRKVKFLLGIVTLAVLLQVSFARIVMVLLLFNEADEGATVVLFQLDPLYNCQLVEAFSRTVPFER